MNIIVIARPENATLIVEMVKRKHEVFVAPEPTFQFLRNRLNAKVYRLHPDNEEAEALTVAFEEASKVMTEKIRDSMQAQAFEIAAMSAAIRKTHAEEGIDALVTWTDAIGPMRAAVLAARSLGIPTFEVTHGALNTYRQGHFECRSYVDYILAPGQEEAAFRKFYGCGAEVIVTGKPAFDWMRHVDRDALRQEIRARYNLPPKRPIVVYGMTWRHPFSTWERDREIGEGDVFEAHAAMLPVCNPLLVVKPHPATLTVPGNMERLRKALDDGGLPEYALTDADSSILLAADMLVSHKSTLLVEGVLLDVPAVGFDFRERNDFRQYEGLGINWVDKRVDLLPTMLKTLLEAPTKERLAVERLHAKHYFNGPDDGMASTRAAMCIESVVAERKGVPVCA